MLIHQQNKFVLVRNLNRSEVISTMMKKMMDKVLKFQVITDQKMINKPMMVLDFHQRFHMMKVIVIDNVITLQSGAIEFVEQELIARFMSQLQNQQTTVPIRQHRDIISARSSTSSSSDDQSAS